MIRKLLVVAGTALVLAACTPTQPEIISDDDPRFDCATMGNRSCTPETWTVTRYGDTVHVVTPDGVLIIVDECVRVVIGETDNAPCMPEE